MMSHHLVLSVDLGDHVLLLLHRPQVLLPPRLLHDVFVVTTSLGRKYGYFVKKDLYSP